MSDGRTIMDDVKATYGWGPWIDWAGRTKKCPLAAGTRHEVRFRSGRTVPDDCPEAWTWKHGKCESPDEDIVAYRVRKAR